MSDVEVMRRKDMIINRPIPLRDPGGGLNEAVIACGGYALFVELDEIERSRKMVSANPFN